MPMSLADALSSKGGGEPDGDEPDADAHGEALMEAFISAVKSSDAAAAYDHLKDLVELCSKGGGDESGPHAMLLLGHKG